MKRRAENYDCPKKPRIPRKGPQLTSSIGKYSSAPSSTELKQMALVRPLISAHHHHHCPFPSNEINTRHGEWSLRRLTSIQMVLGHDPQLSPTDPYSLYIRRQTDSTNSELFPPLPRNVFPLLQMRRTQGKVMKIEQSVHSNT